MTIGLCTYRHCVLLSFASPTRSALLAALSFANLDLALLQAIVFIIHHHSTILSSRRLKPLIAAIKELARFRSDEMLL